MVKTSKKWSIDEDNLLRENYQKRKIELISLFPARTPAAINIRASFLGLKKDRNEYVKGKCDFLLEESLEAYYWTGFILADGYISDLYRLVISLHERDKENLQLLADKLDLKLIITPKNTQVKIYCQDKFIFKELKEKFDIKKCKTYNPPERLTGNISQIFSTLIGLIDGDGSIKKQTARNDCGISIKCHKSWLNYYNLIYDILYQEIKIIMPKPSIRPHGYMQWEITNHKVINFLKQFALDNNLPIFRRKWDRINLQRIFRTDNQKYLRIIPLLEEGKRNKDIAKIIGVSDSYVSHLRKKYLKVDTE